MGSICGRIQKTDNGYAGDCILEMKDLIIQDPDIWGSFDKTYEGWTFYPFIFSNGGQVINEDGTRLLLNSPEAIEAVQSMVDLMWVHHVTPTPDQDVNLPGYVSMLQTGNLAMHISGQWSLIDYASVDNLNFSVAVLPKFDQPVTVVLGSPTVIFAGYQKSGCGNPFL